MLSFWTIFMTFTFLHESVITIWIILFTTNKVLCFTVYICYFCETITFINTFFKLFFSLNLPFFTLKFSFASLMFWIFITLRSPAIFTIYFKVKFINCRICPAFHLITTYLILSQFLAENFPISIIFIIYILKYFLIF